MKCHVELLRKAPQLIYNVPEASVMNVARSVWPNACLFSVWYNRDRKLQTPLRSSTPLLHLQLDPRERSAHGSRRVLPRCSHRLYPRLDRPLLLDKTLGHFFEPALQLPLAFLHPLRALGPIVTLDERHLAVDDVVAIVLDHRRLVEQDVHPRGRGARASEAVREDALRHLLTVCGEPGGRDREVEPDDVLERVPFRIHTRGVADAELDVVECELAGLQQDAAGGRVQDAWKAREVRVVLLREKVR